MDTFYEELLKAGLMDPALIQKPQPYTEHRVAAHVAEPQMVEPESIEDPNTYEISLI